MNDNLDIFISTHKDFSPYPTNKVYKVITDKNIKISAPLDVYYDGDTEIYPRSFAYAEGSRIYWVWKNYPIKKYIGFCHYRSYFDFFDDVPDMDEIFSKYKIIVGEPYPLGNTIRKHYAKCHNINDLNNLIKVMPKGSEIFKELDNYNFLYRRNMFIMKKEDFLNYCEFAFNGLLKFDEKFNLKTTSDVQQLHNTNSYQTRIEGFLLERLTSLYIMANYKPEEIKTYKIKFTEDRIW